MRVRSRGVGTKLYKVRRQTGHPSITQPEKVAHITAEFSTSEVRQPNKINGP